MFKIDNGKDLVSEIRLSEPKCIMPPSEFFNRSKNKRFNHGLVRRLRNVKG